MTGRVCRIAIIGAGVAGALLARLLSHRADVDVACFERVARGDHAGAGTGLNVGPNAIKSLAAFDPRMAASVRAASLPWESWTIALTDGTPLMELPLSEVADNSGVRIRWSELYRVLREAARSAITYAAERIDIAFGSEGAFVNGAPFDLVVAADGRYSAVREKFFGAVSPTHLGVCLWRVLIEEAGPVGDYGQWFNGENRLLAFALPDGAVYCAGSFPIPPGSSIADDRKTAHALRPLYTPPGGAAEVPRFLIEETARRIEEVHWARVQWTAAEMAHEDHPLLLLGDAAHPMVPTLGQGATMAIEDACAAADEVLRTLDDGGALERVPASVAKRRLPRVAFAADLSLKASDTLLAGADPVEGTAWKRGRSFKNDLALLYRDAPMPTAIPA